MAATKNIDYQELIERIGNTYQSAKSKIISAVNIEMLYSYWQIGKDIIEFEQRGKLKADYGKQLLENLAKDLKLTLGKGFSRSNLNYMRLLYIKYPICETLSHKLSWSHYFELLKVDDDLVREFYENHQYTEPDIEKALINNLQQFLLELGKGFAFIGRQQRITLNNRHYFVDLVFYHIKLKCYVLIDLKIGEVEHEHIGQMKLYLGYFAREINEETDNEPIGLILSEEKDDIMVEYAMLNDKSKLIVSKYQLYLPNTEQLKNKVKEILDN